MHDHMISRCSSLLEFPLDQQFPLIRSHATECVPFKQRLGKRLLVNFALSYLPPRLTPTHTIVPVAPRFIEEPDHMVAVKGDSVNFTCSTVSSPRHTLISWLHNGDIIDTGGHYEISGDGSKIEDRGAVTISTLTIDDVSGFDSGPVECRAMADDSQTTSISSKTVIGVLGEWEGLTSGCVSLVQPLGESGACVTSYAAQVSSGRGSSSPAKKCCCEQVKSSIQ